MQHNSPGDIHVIPLNDLYPHIECMSCECQPSRNPETPRVVVHHSYDGRELKERIEQITKPESES